MPHADMIDISSVVFRSNLGYDPKTHHLKTTSSQRLSAQEFCILALILVLKAGSLVF